MNKREHTKKLRVIDTLIAETGLPLGWAYIKKGGDTEYRLHLMLRGNSLGVCPFSKGKARKLLP